jgi:hypothetical protein
MKKSDFDSMIINPFKDFGSVFIKDRYPILNIGIFKDMPQDRALSKSDYDKLIRFVVGVSDMDKSNPLFQISDSDMRYEKMAELLELNKYTFDLVKNQDIVYTELLFNYLKTISSYKYERWLSVKLAYHKLSRILRDKVPTNPQDIKTHLSIAGELAALENDLMKMHSELFADRRIELIVSSAAADIGISNWADIFAEEEEWKNNSDEWEGEDDE